MNAKKKIKEIVGSLIEEVKNMSEIIHFSKSSEGDYHDGMKLGSMLGRYETEVEFLLKELPEEIDTCGILETCEPKAEENSIISGKWYKPEEKMPESGMQVLVEFVGHYMGVAFFDKPDNEWYFRPGKYQIEKDNIARWRELPEGLLKEDE